MKNNIGFFTHEVGAYENGKFLILRAYYGGEKGWAMEAKFWALNCLIGKSDNAKLDLTSKSKRAEVVKALDLSLAELDDFLHVLKDEAELIHNDDGVIWTQQTQDDLSRAMAVRLEAQNRRNGKVGLPSADNSKTSADESKKSADKNHGAEQSGAEQRGVEKSSSYAREAGPVDNLRDELAKIGLALRPQEITTLEARFQNLEIGSGFVAYAWGRVQAMQGVKNPRAFAKKALLGYDDWVTEFKADEKAAALAPPPLPEPPACPECGRIPDLDTPEPGKPRTATCAKCRRTWTYNDDWQEWHEDERLIEVPISEAG